MDMRWIRTPSNLLISHLNRKHNPHLAIHFRVAIFVLPLYNKNIEKKKSLRLWIGIALFYPHVLSYKKAEQDTTPRTAYATY